MNFRFRALTLVISLASCWPLFAESPRARQLSQRFHRTVRPFLARYCLDCHGRQVQESKLDLSPFESLVQVQADLGHWNLVLARLKAGEMPPADAPQIPGDDERHIAIRWIEDVRAHEASKSAGDPGLVLARRLSNAEYDYTIRDLTGADIRPTREFPLDPANESGFSNSGESLSMTPALFDKYLAAAQHVANHLVFMPDGLAFAPFPALTDQDRDKFAVERIIEFYRRQNLDYADFLQAAWTWKHRETLAVDAQTLAAVASQRDVSASYLATLWELLEGDDHNHGPVRELRRRWDALPRPASSEAPLPREACEDIRDWILHTRSSRVREYPAVMIPQLNTTHQPSVLWKNRLIAEQRRDGNLTAEEKDDPALSGAIELFCGVFPDYFMLTERGRMNLKFKDQNKGRLLGAGFHLQVGYYRDDRPLYEMVLNEIQREQLDQMWNELFFVTDVLVRQFQDFIYFERAENPRIMAGADFDFARAEDRGVVRAETMAQIRSRFLVAAEELGVDPDGLQEIDDYFVQMERQIRVYEEKERVARPRHVESLLEFAEAAWRRPLRAEEEVGLRDFYRTLMTHDGLGHEDAIRDVVVSILVSPHFCYRLDEARRARAKWSRLSDHSLANRLSYFLWSSMPDKELMQLADQGQLATRPVLRDQVQRMLQDDRSKALAVEFGGAWLGFRQFQSHQGVDRTHFTEFTDELREAMFQEPVVFLADLIQRDGSITDVIGAHHTFVNARLAEHYGIPWSTSSEDRETWTRVDQADRFGRGGILPMGVFLTSNSPGLRTSPVKRGYWVVKNVLGEHIPAPPADVPEIPDSESDLGGLSLRQVMEKHRESASCASCHDRFDFAGLVFEAFDPVGALRKEDLGGTPVDDRTTYPGAGEGRGVVSLKRYLAEQKQEQFDENFCRKLLAYGLGRGLLLSDEPTISLMKQTLKENEHRFAPVVQVVVESSQFLNKRSTDTERRKK